jgi:hypothetical protein
LESRRMSTRSWKWGGLLFVFLIVPGSSSAQQDLQISAPPIEMLRLKWEKEVRLPRNFDPSVIPTGGTFSDPSSRTSGPPANPSAALDSTRAATREQSAAAGSSNNFPATPGRLPVFYVYSMKIKNLSDKQIEGIAWDYVFIDPNGGAELGRHQFLSYVKAPPNKDVTLKGQMRTAPLRIVSASSNGKPSKPIERASIQCVLFEDETVWRNPAGRKGVCELLKNRTLMKQKQSATQQ